MTSENDTLADPSVLLNTWVQMETGWILEVIPGIDSDVNHISFRTEDGRYLRYVDGGFADLGEPSTVHRGSFILHTRPEGKYALKLSESADEFPGAYLWNNLVGQNRLYDTNWQAAQTPLNLSAYGGPTGTDISANNGGVVVGWWRMFPTGNLFNQPPTLSVANLQTDGGAGEMVMTPNFTDKVRVVREVPNNLRAMLIDNHEQPGPVALRAASVPAGAFSMAEGLTMSAWFAGETTISPTLELQNTDGAYIIPNDNPAFSGWGSTSRMSGDGLVAVVIASNASNVWILSRASTDDPFVETAVLLDPEPHLPGSFGVSDVSISHDGGIIVTTGPGRGHSYLFIRPESGNWAGGGDTRYVKLFLADKRVAVSADGGVVVTQSINNATHNLVFEPPINGGWVSAESTGVDYVRRLAMAPGVEHSTGSFKDMISNQLSLSGDGTTVALSQNWHVWVWQREAGVDSWAGSYDLVYASRLQHRLFGWLWVGYCKVGLSHDGSVLVTAAPSEDGELLESAYWNSYYYYPDAPLDYSGRLYLWERPSSTRWSVPDSGTTSIRENLVTRHETARLVAAYGQQGIGWHRDHTSIRSNHLGAELSINGDGNLIVAHGFSRNGVLRAKGYIYFWTKPTSGWGERGKVVDVVDRGVVGHLPDQPESYPSGYNSNGWNPGGGVYTGHLSLSHDGRHLFVSEGIGMGWRTGVYNTRAASYKIVTGFGTSDLSGRNMVLLSNFAGSGSGETGTLRALKIKLVRDESSGATDRVAITLDCGGKVFEAETLAQAGFIPEHGAGAWIHVAASVDPVGIVSMYLNGNEVAHVAAGTATLATSVHDGVYIGRTVVDDPPGALTGYVCGAAVFSRSLVGEEIGRIYNAGSDARLDMGRIVDRDIISAYFPLRGTLEGMFQNHLTIDGDITRCFFW